MSQRDIEGEGQKLESTLRDAPTWIDADPSRLTQVLVNLLDNASEYTPEGGLGLGLTLVRRISEMHGGSVAAHSAESEQGNRFEVELPVVVDVGEVMAAR